MSRRWVVTGGSRGIGLAVVRRALAAGDRVAVLARRPPPDLAAALGGLPHLLLPADVSDPRSVAGAMAGVAAEWGGIDVLVNNAGLHRGGKLERLPLEDWNAVLATNLSGAMHCIRAALPHMGAGASVVNVGAVVGFRGFPGDAAYGASKAGLAGLTQVMAVELAPRQVRVNLVVPGFVMTEMTAAVDERARERLLARIPLRREGTESEIAEVIHWVAGSTYMTGAVIPTDGGLMCNL